LGRLDRVSDPVIPGASLRSLTADQVIDGGGVGVALSPGEMKLALEHLVRVLVNWRIAGWRVDGSPIVV
jgi:hypothetical protein